MTDFHACQWPDSLLGADVAQHMDRVHNAGLADVAAAIKESKTPVISFSHFLPRQVLQLMLWLAPCCSMPGH